MKRRKFLLASGSTVLTGSAFRSLQRPTIGLEFELSSVPNKDPRIVDSILIDYERLQITPRYIDESEEANFKTILNIEDHGTVSRENNSVSLSNGKVTTYNDVFGKPLVVGVDTDKSHIDGEISTTISHTSIGSETFRKKFTISSTKPAKLDDFEDGNTNITSSEWSDWSLTSSDMDLSATDKAITGSKSLNVLQNGTGSVFHSDRSSDISPSKFYFQVRIDDPPDSRENLNFGIYKDDTSSPVINYTAIADQFSVSGGLSFTYNVGTPYQVRFTNIDWDNYNYNCIIEKVEDGTVVASDTDLDFANNFSSFNKLRGGGDNDSNAIEATYDEIRIGD